MVCYGIGTFFSPSPLVPKNLPLAGFPGAVIMLDEVSSFDSALPIPLVGSISVCWGGQGMGKGA